MFYKFIYIYIHIQPLCLCTYVLTENKPPGILIMCAQESTGRSVLRMRTSTAPQRKRPRPRPQTIRVAPSGRQRRGSPRGMTSAAATLRHPSASLGTILRARRDPRVLRSRAPANHEQASQPDEQAAKNNELGASTTVISASGAKDEGAGGIGWLSASLSTLH